MPEILEYPHLENLTFGSLPYDTHPIDLYDGPQGWGPFNGPWSPWDWHDPAAEISYMYGSGESNDWEFAPPYDIITVFADHSLDYAWNTSYDVVAQQAIAEEQVAYTSTIQNVATPGGSMFARLRRALNGEGES